LTKSTNILKEKKEHMDYICMVVFLTLEHFLLQASKQPNQWTWNTIEIFQHYLLGENWGCNQLLIYCVWCGVME